MERKQKHQTPGAEKSRPVVNLCICNNILKVVFLVNVFESGTWGRLPWRALSVQMMTALWCFCLWAAKMETLGRGVSHMPAHRMDSHSWLRKTCTATKFVWLHERDLTQGDAEDAQFIHVAHLSSSHIHWWVALTTNIQHIKDLLNDATKTHHTNNSDATEMSGFKAVCWSIFFF